MSRQRGQHRLRFVGMEQETNTPGKDQRRGGSVVSAMQFPRREEDEFKRQQSEYAAGKTGGVMYRQ